jgi:serine/threonine protein kinase
MLLSSGTLLGPYEVLSPIGHGGMGEVYKGRDTRLGRIVALKIIREPDAEARQRFQREARAISALNHSLICSLFDVGQQDGIDYLVMEYFEGETLAARLKKGPMAIEETLRIGAQIAEALAALHRENLVHRDLKPGNIMLTKAGIKLLDFGLSKSAGFSRRKAVPDEAVTETTGLTGAGAVVGTVQYIAPEQLAGHEADFRSDLFTLGAVLYEMAAGRTAFRSDSPAGLIAAILERDPPALSSIRQGIPERFECLVQACLVKDPERRWQSAGDLRYALEWINAPDTPAPSTHRARRPLLWLAATCAIAVAIFAGLRLRGEAPTPELETLTYSGQDTQPSVSPDGKSVAFASSRDGHARIWLKEMARGGEFPLTSGEPDGSPKFSPDGATVLFIRSAALYRISSLGGAERKLADNIVAACWSPDSNRIAWARNEGGGSILYTSGVSGEGARVIAHENRQIGKLRWSPDGRTIVAGVQQVVSIVRPEDILVAHSDGSAVRIIPSEAGGFSISVPAWVSPDEIVYVQALAIGAGLATASGSARLVKQNVHSGASTVLMTLPQTASTVDVMPSGAVIMDLISARQNLVEVPLSTVAGLAPARALTPGTAQDRQPVYSPDGKWILFASNRSGNSDLWKVSTRTGELRRITDDPGTTGIRRLLPTANTSSGVRTVPAPTRSGRPMRTVSAPARSRTTTSARRIPASLPMAGSTMFPGIPQRRAYGRSGWTALARSALWKATAATPTCRPTASISRSVVLLRDYRW